MITRVIEHKDSNELQKQRKKIYNYKYMIVFETYLDENKKPTKLLNEDEQNLLADHLTEIDGKIKNLNIDKILIRESSLVLLVTQLTDEEIISTRVNTIKTLIGKKIHKMFEMIDIENEIYKTSLNTFKKSNFWNNDNFLCLTISDKELIDRVLSSYLN